MAGAPSTTGCTNCNAWFHYEDGTTDGYWVVGLTAPCDDIRSSAGTGVSYFGFPFAPLNPTAQFIWIGFNEFSTPVKLFSLAQDLYFRGQTKLSATTGPADDFTIVCADAASPSGPCPPGTYFDNAT